MIQLIGFIAATLTALTFLPQVVKTWRRHDPGDISLGTVVTQFIGAGVWIVYGIKITSLPVIASNVLSMGLTGSLLVLAWRNRSRQPG